MRNFYAFDYILYSSFSKKSIAVPRLVEQYFVILFLSWFAIGENAQAFCFEPQAIYEKY